jgi:NADPH-dependent 2,4-dienoyl-CoA reductase/sulfur reductase-like enzyme
MSETGRRVQIRVDGKLDHVEAGLTVAAALFRQGVTSLRRSVSGEPRGPLCAMGICYECRVTIDGVEHRRACLEPCRDGMEIMTDDGYGDERGSDFQVGGKGVGLGPSSAFELGRPTEGTGSVSSQWRRGRSRTEPDLSEPEGRVIGLRPQSDPTPQKLSQSPAEASRKSSFFRPDIAVLGGGPAGIAAACRAAEAGAVVLLIDEGVNLGGQIDRHRPGRPAPEAARPWLKRLARLGVEVLDRSSVFDAYLAGGRWCLAVERDGSRIEVQALRLVLATGARELFLPFPGWTLPNVLGVGGAQALLKAGAEVRGKRVVIAGSGPLLLPVAAAYARADAEVLLVAEQASRRSLAGFALAAAGSPGKLWEAVSYRAAFGGTPYLTSTWVTAAGGRGRVERATLTDGTETFEVACDLLAVAYGLLPNLELPRLLGCTVRGGSVAVAQDQATSLPGVYAAGEICGVAGVDVARAEGEIAGLAAAGAWEAASVEGRALALYRARGRRLAAAMERAFAPRPELRSLADAETPICRCEDVRYGRLDPAWSPRQAKLATRAGMGPCQGRVCGAALSFLFGWPADEVRSPLQPASLGNLLSSEDRS